MQPIDKSTFPSEGEIKKFLRFHFRHSLKTTAESSRVDVGAAVELSEDLLFLPDCITDGPTMTFPRELIRVNVPLLVHVSNIVDELSASAPGTFLPPLDIDIPDSWLEATADQAHQVLQHALMFWFLGFSGSSTVKCDLSDLPSNELLARAPFFCYFDTLRGAINLIDRSSSP